MNQQNNDKIPDGKETKHEAGSYAAWCGILGAALGFVVGLFLGHKAAFMIMLGILGWVVGAFIERARS